MLPLLPSNMQAWLGNLKLHTSGFLSNLVVSDLGYMGGSTVLAVVKIVLNRKKSDCLVMLVASLIPLIANCYAVVIFSWRFQSSFTLTRTVLVSSQFAISVVPTVAVTASRVTLIRCCDFAKSGCLVGNLIARVDFGCSSEFRESLMLRSYSDRITAPPQCLL